MFLFERNTAFVCKKVISKFTYALYAIPCNALYVIASENTGTPRDTVYPWGKGAHKQKSEHYLPDNAISKAKCAPHRPEGTPC